jgi:hypothetical protein
MKFIPLQSFEAVNSLLQGVDALGCSVTIRLEAFACRMSRSEKTHIITIGGGMRSPLIKPESHPANSLSSSFGFGPEEGLIDLPAPMTMLTNPPAAFVSNTKEKNCARGTTTSGSASALAGSGGGGGGGGEGEVLDERFVYLVAALNAIHGETEYDFSVLSPQDFVLLDGPTAVEEVNRVLSALPATCAPVVGGFWAHVASEISPERTTSSTAMSASSAFVSSSLPSSSSSSCASSWMDECDFFQFANRECDPLYHRSVWSSHFFIYSKRQRMVVSLMMFGEGNMYRGDDAEPEPYWGSSEEANGDSGDGSRWVGGGDERFGGGQMKNKSFYGY